MEPLYYASPPGAALPWLTAPLPLPVLVPGPKGPMVIYMVPAPAYYGGGELVPNEDCDSSEQLQYINDPSSPRAHSVFSSAFDKVLPLSPVSRRSDPLPLHVRSSAVPPPLSIPDSPNSPPLVTTSPAPIRIIDDCAPGAADAAVGSSLKERIDAQLPPPPPTNVAAAAAAVDLDLCQLCQACPPHRPGMQYCSPCFRSLPFCQNYQECRLRTNNKEHGYCSQCFYKYRALCVECHRLYCMDGSGLCRPCTERAPPLLRGQCHNWWLETDDAGQERRVVCSAKCARRRRFCRDCWLSMEP